MAEILIELFVVALTLSLAVSCAAFIRNTQNPTY